MNWEAVGAIGEVTGAVGVVATLAYLAAQIRQNNRQMRGSALVTINEISRSLTSDLRRDPAFFDILKRATFDWDSLDEAGQARAHTWLLEEAQFYETTFELLRQGAIDRETYETREAYYLRELSVQDRRRWWERYRYSLSEAFQQRINAKLKDTPLVSREEFVERFPFYNAPESPAGEPKN